MKRASQAGASLSRFHRGHSLWEVEEILFLVASVIIVPRIPSSTHTYRG